MHCSDLLAVELRIVILIEQEELHDACGETRQATQLARIDRINDVHDLERRDADDLACETGVREIARVPPQEMIRDAPADRIELDSLPDDVAVRCRLVPIQRQ